MIEQPANNNANSGMQNGNVSQKTPHFWEGSKVGLYFQELNNQRSQLIKEVDSWSLENEKGIDSVIELFSNGIANIKSKIDEMIGYWERTLKAIELDQTQQKKLVLKNAGSSNAKILASKENQVILNCKTEILFKWMNSFMLDIDHHNLEQSRAIDVGVQRVQKEVIAPLKTELQKIKKGSIAKSTIVEKKRVGLIAKVNKMRTKKKAALKKFLSIANANQSQNSKNKFGKKDTLKCLVRLAIKKGDIFSMLKELGYLLNEIWDDYGKVLESFTNSYFQHVDLYHLICKEYQFPGNREVNQRPFEGNQYLKRQDFKHFKTIFEQKDVLQIGTVTEAQDKQGIEELCSRLHVPFIQRFAWYVGESWMEQSTSGRNTFYWILISQELTISIFKLESNSQGKKPIGQAVVSDSLANVKLSFNESKRRCTVKGRCPGALFFDGSKTFQFTDRSVFDRITELINSGKAFIQEIKKTK